MKCHAKIADAIDYNRMRYVARISLQYSLIDDRNDISAGGYLRAQSLIIRNHILPLCAFCGLKGFHIFREVMEVGVIGLITPNFLPVKLNQIFLRACCQSGKIEPREKPYLEPAARQISE